MQKISELVAKLFPKFNYTQRVKSKITLFFIPVKSNYREFNNTKQ